MLFNCLQPLKSVGSSDNFCSLLNQELADGKSNVRVIFYNDNGYIAKLSWTGHMKEGLHDVRPNLVGWMPA
jgi:hypothetical protein